MADLIDRYEAINAICGIGCGTNTMCAAPCGEVQAVLELPSIKAEPVRHGRWIESDTDGFVCSVCRNGYINQPTLMGKPMFEYCPVCGARMDEVTQ